MPTTLQPLAPPQAGPQPRTRWTVEQFNHMGDLGWFEGRRAFLLDGVILENGPMDTPHASAIRLVQFTLQRVFGAGWGVGCQLPLNIDEWNNPFPDFAVVRGGPRDYLTTHPTTAELVIEIADTSLAIDTTEKAERYATAGILDYWVLDLNARQLIVFRDPVALPAGLGATAYATRRTLNPTDTFSPLAAPSATITVTDLLP